MKMKSRVFWLVFTAIISMSSTYGSNDIQVSQENIASKDVNAVINLSVVACGDRAPETLVLLKSALMFTKSRLHFYIFTESTLKNVFVEQFRKWPTFIQNKFEYTIEETSFPQENQNEWRQLFKLCASQRIFLPSLLNKVDSLLYVDTDVLFLTDLQEIWKMFSQFNSSQLAGLAPEHEDANMGWYNRFARHPFYGKLGLNSGVMLMNLTRMREFHFEKKILPIYKTYKYNITWGDQCLLNILFHFHPDKLFTFDCEWNYRPDHCMYGSNCKTAESNGAQILHGCRRAFHKDDMPAFKLIYKIFDEYNFEEENRKNLFKRIKEEFEADSVQTTYCGRAKDVFLKTLRAQLKEHKTIMSDARKEFEEKPKASRKADSEL